MSQVEVLSLLIALSVALNIAFGAGWVAHRTGGGLANAVLVAGGTAGASLVIFFAGVSAFR
ncbi:hypothetical protein ACIHCQ_00010 [Streptomyces sp. NPDC052236]|uniref:hypothetical protein n=1 Tax=Streptomyces sp. NPDC052236 TaxID=3365686 RepID=UPI0037D8D135